MLTIKAQIHIKKYIFYNKNYNKFKLFRKIIKCLNKNYYNSLLSLFTLINQYEKYVFNLQLIKQKIFLKNKLCDHKTIPISKG